MPYRWWILPNKLDICWMTYGERVDEYASQLANTISDQTHRAIAAGPGRKWSRNN